MAVSKETQDFLEQVKKGKPRKFVLLVKGATIVNLILYKKGAPSKFVKQAKEAGTGAAYYGVATGKGMDINFQLAVADGFDKAPVKDLILKKYLEEEADFKCKPLIEIVQARSLALDPDDPLHARFIALQPKALEACEARPDDADKINSVCLEIGKLLDEDERDAATAKIVELEKLLGGGTPISSTGTTSQTSPPPQTSTETTTATTSTSGTTPDADKAEKTYHALRAKLEPLLLDVQKAMPDKAAAYGNLWSFSETQAKSGNYAAANKALAGLADGIAKAKAGAKPNVDVLKVWNEAKEEADEQLNRFVKALRDSGDDYLVKVAEGGIHSFAEGPTRVYVKLTALLMDYKASSADKRDAARTKALQAIKEYGAFLDASEFLEVCDTNDLCPLTIRSTLKASLSEIEQGLAV